MKIRDHNQTADLIDSETTDVLEYLSKQKDKSSDEYTKAVANLDVLQSAKEKEVSMKNETKKNLVPEFASGFATAFVTVGAITLMYANEASGEVVLQESSKRWMRALPKPKIH